MDSGAEVTMISTTVCEKIPKESQPRSQPPLKRVTQKLIIAAKDHGFATDGVAMLNLTLGSLEFRWTV